MNRALILGTNAGQAEMITYLKHQNWEVHACAHQHFEPGEKLSDQFHLVDILDVLEVKKLALKIKPDIIYSVASDIAIRTATLVSAELNLPHLLNSDIIDLFHYKQRLRGWLSVNNLGAVDHITVTNPKHANKWVTFPCIVKPIDSHGQRGLSLVKNKTDLYNAVAGAINCSDSSSAIIEEYLEGTELSSHVVVQNNQIIVNEITERYVHSYPYIGLPEGHAIPPRNVENSQLKSANSFVEKLVYKLNISDAVLYIQFMITPDGPKIIEVAPRLDGCHIWRLIRQACNYDLREYALNCLTGKKINHNSHSQTTVPCTLFFHQMKTGTIFSKTMLNKPENLLYSTYRYNEGDTVDSVNDSLEVVGYYIEKS